MIFEIKNFDNLLESLIILLTKNGKITSIKNETIGETAPEEEKQEKVHQVKLFITQVSTSAEFFNEKSINKLVVFFAISHCSKSKLFKGKNIIEKITKFTINKLKAIFESQEVFQTQDKSIQPQERSQRSKKAYFKKEVSQNKILEETKKSNGKNRKFMIIFIKTNCFLSFKIKKSFRSNLSKDGIIKNIPAKTQITVLKGSPHDTKFILNQRIIAKSRYIFFKLNYFSFYLNKYQELKKQKYRQYAFFLKKFLLQK